MNKQKAHLKKVSAAHLLWALLGQRREHGCHRETYHLEPSTPEAWENSRNAAAGRDEEWEIHALCCLCPGRTRCSNLLNREQGTFSGGEGLLDPIGRTDPSISMEQTWEEGALE